MSPLTGVLNFIPPTATVVRPVQVLPRHFGCGVVRGALGLIEPTTFIEFEFFTSGCCAISALVCALGDALLRSTSDRHDVIARLQLIEIVGPPLHHLAPFDEMGGTVVRAPVRISHGMR